VYNTTPLAVMDARYILSFIRAESGWESLAVKTTMRTLRVSSRTAKSSAG
jgi:hypothetical protein